ncbi:J domain-containing protein [Erythrobacter litoralis]|uniref:J domain-containing protein n=1 Tax=Erythrobacter litoralis (strain HTCC2594) TaxID=314225 RepID=Q2N657_ERYLH|nr:J domain-containing protein [Erythrobacter litoralis]ABC64834.1 hypothetical protein ELI_13710 [Erythrobacter litoralis HTCC2594]
MLRLLILAAIVSLVCRWTLGKWPWEYLGIGGSTRDRALERARRLLGVAPGANRNDIIAAHKRLVAMVHPDRGGSNEQVHEANAARDLLLDEASKDLPPR